MRVVRCQEVYAWTTCQELLGKEVAELVTGLLIHNQGTGRCCMHAGACSGSYLSP